MNIKQNTKPGRKIVRRNAINLMAFGYAAGWQNCGEQNFEEAARAFIQHFSLEGEVRPESLARQMRRMILEYFQEGI